MGTQTSHVYKNGVGASTSGTSVSHDSGRQKLRLGSPWDRHYANAWAAEAYVYDFVVDNDLAEDLYNSAVKPAVITDSPTLPPTSNPTSNPTNTDTTCRSCPSGTIQYPGTHRCFARKWSGFLCNLDPATDPATHHANDPKCVCSVRFCVAVGSQIKGVYSDVESARLRLGQFSQGYRMVCEMREQSA